MLTCAHLLAVSHVPGRAPLPAGATPFGSATVRYDSRHGQVWVLPLTTPGEPAERLFGLSLGIRDSRGRAMDDGELARRIRTGTDLDLVAAPFAALLIDEDGATDENGRDGTGSTGSTDGGIVAAADYVGLRHLYAARGDGWAAVSTSSTLLARLAGTGIDETALGLYRITGFHLGLGTPFAGVGKLPAGARWRLRDGRLHDLPGRGAWRHDDDLPRNPHGAASLLRDSVAACLDEHPDTVFELSGGLDSRIALAAVPQARRAGLHALTLATPGSADARVAGRIAADYGLKHQVVDLAGLGALTPADAWELVLGSARRHDSTGNPVALGVLDWAEAQAGPGVRINGQGGEVARGFYFGEPQGGVSDAKVDRFFRWWFTANDAVPAYCLEPAFAEASQQAVRDRLRAIFASYPAGIDWRSATDEFYLRERIHRWVGINYTGACLDRTIVSPYLDARFVGLAFDLPPDTKRSSGFAARVLELLDPRLARMRLASGLRPVTFPRRLSEYTVRNVVSGVSRKLIQRVAPSDRPPVGAGMLAHLVVTHWREHPQTLAREAFAGLVREDWLDGLLAGTHGAGAAAVGFLTDLQAAHTARQAPLG